MRSQVEACWLPEALEQKLRPLIRGCTPIIKRYERDGDYMDVLFRRLSPEALEYAASFLRDQRNRVLREKSVYAIARALNLAAEKWLDPTYPPRRRAIEHISLITGFSTEMVAHSIDLEQRSSRYEHLVQALVNELGSPDYLDGFQPNANLCGMSQAIGPDLVGAIFSSNIPALPHLEIMRALLVKSPCLGRVSAGEPVFLRLYVETLHEIDPDLASCIVVTYWNHDELDCEKAFLESIDYLVAYGSEAQTARLASVKPPELRASWHGHKVGFTYILREALAEERISELAQRVAYDFSIFDGYACLCPQVCFVETGGKLGPEVFAEECARWMSDWAAVLPPRRLSLSEASRKYQLRELYFARESMNDPVSIVAAPDDFSFTVVIEETSR
ncbi:MAG TPA: acyl-CoA reductase, partial [Blastocatellia bacterium]|nr:acyl-CoA reductase [Blastocatellia bacterium]